MQSKEKENRYINAFVCPKKRETGKLPKFLFEELSSEIGRNLTGNFSVNHEKKISS